MRKKFFMTVCLGALMNSIAQAETCLDTEKLVKLDAQYENALQSGNVQFLDKLLAPEFYWVHNLGNFQETKTQLLTRIKKTEAQAYQRRSHDINVHRLGNTAVLRGLSSVDKLNPDGKTLLSSRYQFMRTYVEQKGLCQLLAVQTMKVWSSEGD